MPKGRGFLLCKGEKAGCWRGTCNWAVPRAKPDAVPAGRRDCLPALPGARTANREQKRHADSEKANSYCLWRAGGEKENLRFAGNRRQDRRKRHDDAEKANSYCLWRAEGKRKNLRLAGNQRQDRSKRHADAEKTNSYCLWRARGEKENLRLAENRRQDRRKIIRWRIGFGTAGRRNRPFPAAAGDCPAR